MLLAPLQIKPLLDNETKRRGEQITTVKEELSQQIKDLGELLGKDVVDLGMTLGALLGLPFQWGLPATAA
jgi:hypothetical protein